MSFSQIIAVAAAFAAGLSGIAALLDQLNPKYAVVATILSTFIAIFCKEVQTIKRDSGE